MGVRPYERDRGKQSFPGRELTVAVASTQLLENHFPDFYQSLLKYPENIGKNIKNDFFCFKNRLDKRPVFQLCHYMADIRNHYAIVAELRALGASIDERDDGFIVQGPTRLRGALVQSHGDHRLAMAMIAAGLIADGETVVEGIDVIADSFPGFVALMRELGAEIE